jgi:RHS repeat-associated protein
MEYYELGQMTQRIDRYGTSSARTTAWTYGSTPAAHDIGKPIGMSVADQDPLTPVDSSRGLEYDSLGRLFRTTDVIGGETFVTRQSYDTAGRPKTVTYPVTNQYATGFRVSRVYNENGYLRKVQMADGSKVFWEAEEVNARGQTVTDTLGNGLSTTRLYDETTGWLDTLVTLDAQNDAVQHMTYGYLANGSLNRRTDMRQGGLEETFGYDSLNRLTSAHIAGGTANYTDKDYQYDILGNITSKTGVGYYKYGAECSTGAGPHAVCEIRDGGGTLLKSYSYNGNGSVIDSAGRDVDYTGFNKPSRFTEGSTQVSFAYGADLNRVFQEVDAAAKHTLTYYIGLGDSGGALFERETDLGVTPNLRENRHYIYAGGAGPVAMHVTRDNGTTASSVSNKYFHHDHLGSVEAISDDTGLAANAVHMSYDAWGLRRNPDWSDATGGLPYVDGARGFTGHEDLPEVSLIHMGGRVYDPVLGRFQSADPYMQPHELSRGMNRYGYVLNNPLTLTDPTGYRSDLERAWKKFWKRDLKPFLNRLTRHCSSCGVGVGYGTNNGFHVYGGGQPSPYGNALRTGNSIPWQRIGSAAEEMVSINYVNSIKDSQNTEDISKDGETVSENGANRESFKDAQQPKATDTSVAGADAAQSYMPPNVVPPNAPVQYTYDPLTVMKGVNAVAEKVESYINAFTGMLKEHIVGTLSVRGGYIYVGALDVSITHDNISVYLGAGLGAGLSASASAGARAGEATGMTTKVTFQGGFGGGGRATFRMGEGGVAAAAAVGTVTGFSVSATTGYTWNFSW